MESSIFDDTVCHNVMIQKFYPTDCERPALARLKREVCEGVVYLASQYAFGAVKKTLLFKWYYILKHILVLMQLTTLRLLIAPPRWLLRLQ